MIKVRVWRVHSPSSAPTLDRGSFRKRTAEDAVAVGSGGADGHSYFFQTVAHSLVSLSTPGQSETQLVPLKLNQKTI